MYVKTNNVKVTDKLPVNVKIAEHQPEYHTLPCHRTSTGIVAVAFDLTEEDIEKIKKHKQIYYLQEVGNTQKISFNVSREKLKDILATGETTTIKLEVEINTSLQPINLALTPEDIEEAVEISHELRMPTNGETNG